MLETSFTFVLHKKYKTLNDMAKVQIKTEKLTPFGRIFLIMELLIKRLPSLFNALEISDFIVAKKQSSNLDAMGKGTTILSDLRDFFSENENNRAINSIMRAMGYINIRSSQIVVEKKEKHGNLTQETRKTES